MTGRITTFILGMIFTLYIAVLYKSSGLLFLLYTEFFIGIVLFIIDFVIYAKINISLETDYTVCKDGQIGFNLNIENRSFFPSGRISIIIICTDSYTMKHKKFTIEQWCSGRKKEIKKCKFKGNDWDIMSGKYIISVKKVSVYDYLGFFRIVKRMGSKIGMTQIIPVTEGEEVKFTNTLCEEIDTIINVEKDKSGEFDHVREYIVGDKLRNIHWKLSSKSEDIYVKEFTDGFDSYYCYYIETRPLNRKEISKEFKRWDAAGSYAIEMGKKIVFIWYDPRQKDIKKAYVSNEEELFCALCEINVYEGIDKNLIVDMDMLMEMEKKG